MDWVVKMLTIILIVILTCVNALFAASEMALVSISPSTLYSLQEENKKNGKILEKVTKDSTKYLSTIQVAITFSGFLSSAFAGSQLSDSLISFLGNYDITISSSVAVILITLLLSFFTLVFGELVPKKVALSKSTEIALLCAPIIYFFMLVFTPFVWLLTKSTNGVTKLFGISKDTGDQSITEQDIKEMIVYGHIEGLYKEDEKQMMERIFSFDDIEVNSIMTPDEYVTWVDLDDDHKNIIDMITKSRFSRLPVYKGDKENLVGVIVVKDILLKMQEEDSTEVDLNALIRPPLIVSEEMKINDLFRRMNELRKHLAFIRNSKDLVVGIITLEDIIEEIVGEIYDEHDDADITVEGEI